MLINDIAVLLQNERRENKAWRRNLHDAECDLFLATSVRSILGSSFRFFVKIYYEMMWQGDGVEWNDSNNFLLLVVYNFLWRFKSLQQRHLSNPNLGVSAAVFLVAI